MDNLIIKEIKKDNNKAIITYEKNGKWNDCLNGNEFFCSYDCNIDDVPDSILIIPFLCNVLPISWVLNLSISVNMIEKVFNDSIPEIIKGYKQMYPEVDFKSKLKYNNVEDLNETRIEKSSVLFSGGVDATCTLFRHLDERPDIITVFGSDIKLDDENGIKCVDGLNRKTAKDLNINYTNIYSNFRDIMNYKTLTDYVRMIGNYEWWHEFQHGIGLIGLVAPLSYVNGYTTVYIASSYCATQKGEYKCASDPLIDNKLKYGFTETNHDGYELNRQDKIELICNYKKNNNIDNVLLRVCWENTVNGKNCCHCEKCYRTMLGLMVEKENPNDYYFVFDDKCRKRMIKFLKRELKYKTGSYLQLYVPIQEKLNNMSSVPNDLKWLKNYNIGVKTPGLLYFYKKKIYKKINDILKQIKK